MKKFFAVLIISFFAVPLLLTPLSSSAALVECNPSYTVDSGGDITISRQCTVCDFIAMGDRIVTFMLEIAILIATLMIAWGAFTIMTGRGNPEQLKSGKAIMFAAITGVVVALAAWVIIASLMRILTGTGEAGFTPPWQRINCADPSAPTIVN